MISKSTQVDRPIEDLADLLGARPPDWLIPFASIAVHTGEAAGARRAGTVTVRGPRRVRRIDIDLIDVPQGDDPARVDAGVRWGTNGFRWTFSSFDGRLSATRETADTSTLTLEGSYESPSGAAAGGDAETARVASLTAASMLLTMLKQAVEEQARARV